MYRPQWRHVAAVGLAVSVVAHAPASEHVRHGAQDSEEHGHMVESGQSAFAAIAEIVALLEADPDTDWSTVNLGALREHLVDMNEVLLRAAPRATLVSDGIEIDVLGADRTLEAIWRMVPAHAAALDAKPAWRASGERLAQGARLRVTSDDGEQVARIQGLGFFGLLATGAHHQPHHLAIARGHAMHGH